MKGEGGGAGRRSLASTPRSSDHTNTSVTYSRVSYVNLQRMWLREVKDKIKLLSTIKIILTLNDDQIIILSETPVRCRKQKQVTL